MKAINLFLLAALVGMELILGVVVARVIFYPQDLIGEEVLSFFQSGLIMTQIFIQFGYVLLVISSINLLFELYSYFKDEAQFRLRFSKLALSLLIFVLSLLFVFYFTAYIVEAQALGESATKSSEFKSMHSASEVVMKIILIMQIFLYFLSFKIAKKV